MMITRHVLILSLSLLIFTGFTAAQERNRTEEIFENFFNSALTDKTAYENLRILCSKFPGRLCGTPEAAGAVEFTRQIMLKMSLDRVYLQEVMVKNWKREKNESATITSSIFGSKTIPVCSLGMSVGVRAGILGRIIEVRGIADLKSRPAGEVKGKIVFFNQEADPIRLNTFASYGGAVPQRTDGASEAGRKGAIAVLVRSVTLALDSFPHTGVLRYQDGVKKIPAVSISTLDSEILSDWLSKDKNLTVGFKSKITTGPDLKSYNVIGEIRGSKYPDKIITVGGHLDCWDNSPGAHDDGGGCLQSIEVLRLFLINRIRPFHTIRAVMFMDEEVAQRGGLAYARVAAEKKERHIAALESDRGVFQPRGIGISAGKIGYRKLIKFQPFFSKYGIQLTRGGGGVDIGPLKGIFKDITLLSLVPENQRYFDYHHSAADTFDTVNHREMQMGSASIACIIYLIDRNF